MLQTKSKIEVADYVEACALRSARVPLVDLVIRGNRVAFLFADPAGKGSETLQAHRNGTLKVSSAAFAESLHSLKTMMFSLRRERGLE